MLTYVTIGIYKRNTALLAIAWMLEYDALGKSALPGWLNSLS